MPKIQAPTVAEHRRRQHRALLDAARSLLGETGQAPTLAAVGKRAGLARSSVYQYFSSRDDLLTAVVADVFPAWAGQVREAVAAAPTAGERIWAYIRANIELFTGSEQAVATALRAAVDPQTLEAPMKQFHVALQQPLLTALAEHGESHPRQVADLINSLVLQAASSTTDADAAMDLLRRLVGGYLDVPR